MKRSMIKFLIATAIFLGCAIVAIFIDAAFCTLFNANSIPTILYYGFGWMASGFYVLASTETKENKHD